MRLALALVLLPLATGCYATKVMRAPALVPTEPAPGLLVSTIVETIETESQDADAFALAQTVANLANNAELDQFGGTVEPEVTAWLATQGVAQTTDKDRLMVGKSTDWAQVANDFTILSGTWVDPDGLGLRVATDTLFSGATFRSMAQKLDGPEGRELYTYTTVSIYPRHLWLVVGVPRVRVSVLVHDENGNTLLRAKAWGKGKQLPFFVDRSPESLGKGFAEAMAKFEDAEVEVLEVK
jgi:hypothetical protein